MTCNPFVVQFAKRFCKVISCSAESGDFIAHRFKSVGLPCVAESVHNFPDKSGTEKSGAGIGAKSHVSHFVGSGSIARGAFPEGGILCFSGVLNSSMRDGAVPSSTQIL